MDIGKASEALFNGALSQLDRLNMLKLFMHDSRIAHNWAGLVDILIAFRNELNPRMSNEQKIFANGLETQLWNMRGNPDFNVLIKYERYLLDLEHQFGFDTPNKPQSQADEV